jgi:phage repressor protein C with HTH and peptisase S24 domain
MTPTLRDGDHLLVWLRPPKPAPRPGGIVLVELPGDRLSAKRLVRVEPDGRLWVEGDNPVGSTDSRTLGALPPDSVRGRVLLRLWPRPGYVRTSP